MGDFLFLCPFSHKLLLLLTSITISWGFSIFTIYKLFHSIPPLPRLLKFLYRIISPSTHIHSITANFSLLLHSTFPITISFVSIPPLPFVYAIKIKKIHFITATFSFLFHSTFINYNSISVPIPPLPQTKNLHILSKSRHLTHIHPLTANFSFLLHSTLSNN